MHARKLIKLPATSINELATDPITSSQTDIIEGATLDQFLVSPNEQECLSQFELTIFKYIQQRTTDSNTPTLQQFLLEQAKFNGTCTWPVSTYKYIEVLDMNADSKEAVLTSLDFPLDFPLPWALYGVLLKHLVVITDAKIFPYVHDIKKEHAEDFKWLILYPGDFHILLNYQKVIIKVYWDASLKQLASASGFEGATLSNLQNCSNFTNTTRFIFQVWEALYSHMYLQYETTLQRTEEEVGTLENFQVFVEEKAKEDDNWSFGQNSFLIMALHLSLCTCL